MHLDTKARYTLSGIGLGLAFPLAGWSLDIIFSDLAFLPVSIVQIHQSNPLHYIVDLAPFVLGVVFYFLGLEHQRAISRNFFSSHFSDDSVAESTSRFKATIPVVTVLLLLLLGVSSGYVQHLMKLNTQSVIGNALDSILTTSEQAAYFSLQEEQSHILTWAKTESILQAAQALLPEQGSRKKLIALPAQSELRKWFGPIQETRGYQGFFVISPEGINLASSRNENTGDINRLSQHAGFLEKIWRGRTAQSTPEHAIIALRNTEGKLQKGLITMFIAAPITDGSGEVVAALAFRLDPHVNLSPIFRQARILDSGETYAFIREGEIITHSRFKQHIEEFDLEFTDTDGTVHLEVRDPGVNLTLGEQTDIDRDQQPFTLMAISAMAGESGQDLEGYRDYRGVPVIGSWMWSDRLGFGLTTEIDVDEAYAVLNFGRRIVTLSTILLGVLIAGFFAFLFRFRNQSRKTAQILIENERTTRLLLNSTGEAIYGIDLNGDCTFANQSCLMLLGNQTEEELIGKNMHALIHHTHNDGTPYPVEECKIYQAFREGVACHVEDEVLWRVDGTSFDSEYRSYPMHHRGKIIGSVVSFADISDRKKLEKEKELSEARFQGFFNISREGIIFHDKGTILDVNLRIEELFGYDRVEIIGNNILELAAPESKMELAKLLASGGESVEDQRFTTIGQHKDGSKLDIVAHTSLHQTENGNVRVVFLNDVTAQVASEIRHRTVTETMKDGLITINEQREIESFNPTAENLFGYSKEEILGKNINCLMPEPFHSQHEKYVNRYLETGEAKILGISGIEVEGKKKDGTTFPIAITISEMFIGGERIFSGVIRDMTDKVASERERELVAAELSQLIDTANAPIIGLNKKLQINEWNQSAAATTGYDKEEILDCLFIDELVKEDHKVTVRKVFEDALQGIETASFDLILTTKQGRDLNILLNASTRRNVDGVVTGIIGVGQDVTELRLKEKEFNQAKTMVAIGQLTGGIAHDFNNLLSIIKGNLRFLQQDIGETDSDIDELFEDAMSAVDDGADLTKRLLSFSRSKAMQSETKNVGETIEKFARFLARTLGENIELNTDLPEEKLFINVDSSQLENALLNLCINCRDAMPDGGTIIIAASRYHHSDGDNDADTTLTLADGDYILINVSDSGSGISPADLLHVYEPFFTTKDVGKGSGLGLSMVYGFIQQSGAQCTINSRLGEGTTVSMYFPEQQAEEENEVQTYTEAVNAASDAEVILVVEDEPRVRRITLRDLGNLGYKTLEAENGDVAKEIIESGEQIDLLFSDVLMPGEMDGHMLGVWTEENYPHIKVVLTSGYSKGKADVNRDGAHPFQLIRKPYSIEKLAAQIRSKLHESDS